MAKRARLTKRLVDALKASPSEFTLWDSDLTRFGVRVRPEGSRVYFLRLRVRGRQRWYTIGRHGDPWTTETARDEARRVLGQSENVKKLRETGQAPQTLRHPVEARDRGKATPTLAAFAERYLSEYAEAHKKARTVDEDRGLLGLRPKTERKDPRRKRTILDSLGTLRLDGITRGDVTRLHLAWKETPTRANRALSLLSHMFTTAEEWGVLPDGANPCRRVERFAEDNRERYLSAQEMARLGAALKATERRGPDGSGESPYAVAAIRLLVFTGCRMSEVLTLRWEHVDLGAEVLRLPDSKTGKKTIRLVHPPASCSPIFRASRETRHVIVGGKDGDYLKDLERPWRRIRESAGLANMRLSHDLRHSYASVAVAGGHSLPIIGALLGHTQSATTQKYAHLGSDPLRQASEAIGKRIKTAMSGKKAAEAPADLRAARQRKARR